MVVSEYSGPGMAGVVEQTLKNSLILLNDMHKL